MLITCDNKGCMKQSDALLNPKTFEVICQECGKTISNVSDAMKRALKSFGQIVRDNRKAFMLACQSCKTNREVVIDQSNDTICAICYAPMKVHPAFKLAIETSGGFRKIETQDAEKVEKKKKIVKRKKV